MAEDKKLQSIRIGEQTFTVTPSWERLGITREVVMQMISRCNTIVEIDHKPADSLSDNFFYDAEREVFFPFETGQCVTYPDSDANGGYGMSVVVKAVYAREGDTIPSKVHWLHLTDLVKSDASLFDSILEAMMLGSDAQMAAMCAGQGFRVVKNLIGDAIQVTDNIVSIRPQGFGVEFYNYEKGYGIYYVASTDQARTAPYTFTLNTLSKLVVDLSKLTVRNGRTELANVVSVKGHGEVNSTWMTIAYNYDGKVRLVGAFADLWPQYELLHSQMQSAINGLGQSLGALQTQSNTTGASLARLTTRVDEVEASVGDLAISLGNMRHCKLMICDGESETVQLINPMEYQLGRKSNKTRISVVLFVDGQQPIVIGMKQPDPLIWYSSNFETGNTLHNKESMIEQLGLFNGMELFQTTANKVLQTSGQDFNAFKNQSAAGAAMNYDGRVQHLMTHNLVGIESGYWYLPSIGEMYAICAHLDEINACLELIGGDPIEVGHPYWTATEFNTASAWCVAMSQMAKPFYMAKESSALLFRPIAHLWND